MIDNALLRSVDDSGGVSTRLAGGSFRRKPIGERFLGGPSPDQALQSSQ